MAVDLERLVKQLLNFRQQTYNVNFEYIQHIENYFNNEHTTSEIDFALSLLLKSEGSLLDFIREVCCINNNKKLVDVAAKGLDLILHVIENYIYRVVKYADNIKKVCTIIIQAKTISADCRVKAYSVLIALFTSKVRLKKSLFSIDEVKVFVDKLFDELCNASKYTPTVLQKIYELWGVLGEHYETAMSPKAGQILNNIVKKLQSQTGSKETVKMALLTGCLNGLTGLLVNFNPDGGNRFEDIYERRHTSSIYECITKLCVYDPEHTRKLAHRAALGLLTRHMTLFWHLMFPEYKWWHKTLKKWTEMQGLDRKAGIAVLARFQQEVAEHVSRSTDDENKEAFQYFVKYYKDTLESPRTSSQELALTIQGFGNLSSACSKLMSCKDVEVMFNLVLQRVQQMFMGLESEKERLENLSDFIVALSNIIRNIENVSEGQLASLEQLCIFAIGCYPSVLPQHQPNIIRALKISIINIALTKGNKLGSFLSNIVYQGVIRTCSHVGIGAEVEMEDVITYKSYLALWKSLLNLADDKKLAANTDASAKLVENVAVQLYNVIIETLISLIDKLDASTQQKPQGILPQESTDVPLESEKAVEATCIGDVTMLLNLADLYNELLLPASPHIKGWLSTLTYNIINKAVSFPIIASFYKLLAVVLKCADHLEYFKCSYTDDIEEVEWTSHYLIKFVEDVLVKLRRYKGDLQISCLQVVMATPVVVLEPLLELIAPTLQVVFSVGRSYLELAHKGMDALERWQKDLPSQRLNNTLLDILPSFDPFLRSKVCSGDAGDNENIHVPKSQIRRQKMLAEESELSRLQKRMLEFLSQLNTPTCLALLEQEQMSAVAWSADKFLQVAVPFPDVRLEIYLDDFLPRVVELALSSERATRSAAGELLHAITMVILVKGQEIEKSNSESLEQVLKHIDPALLQLGSHPDLLTRQLFRPLVIQMTHWLSSKWMIQSPQTSVMLEAIWDGLTHPTDTGVRDFSAVCIREFVTWSIKQLVDIELELNPMNVKAVVKQINTYCLHPSPHKRFGAALAFNSLYQELREHTNLTDIFWLEMFYHFLRNLALSRTEDTLQIVQAIDHLERVFCEKSDLFNKESKERRVPLELKGPLLKDLMVWLLEQCASSHEAYRKKCMQLVQSLSRYIPDCGKVNEFLEGSYMKNGDYGAGLGTYFLRPLPSAGLSATISSVITWLKQLRSSLDCYAWMAEHGFRASPSLLSPGASSFCTATKFLLSISLSSATPVMEALRGETFQDIVLSVQEETEFKVAKCKAVVQLFQFVSLEACINDLPEEFWSEQWWKVVSSCVLTPTKSDFGINNQDLVSRLPEIMYQLLTTLRKNLKNSHLLNLYAALDSTDIGENQTVCDDLKAILSGLQNVSTEIKNQLQGMWVLHRCLIFPRLKMATSWRGETILEAVASAITDSSGRAVEPNPAALNYARSLLSFCFFLHTDVTRTLEYVLDPALLTDSTVTKGEHFTKLFKNQLLDHLTEDPSLQCINYLLNEVNLYKVDFIQLLLKHCEYSPSNTNRPGKNLSAELSKRWHQLERWADGDLTLQQIILDIATCVSKCFRNPNACFKSTEMESIKTWMLSQIAAPDTRLPLRLKADVLKLLPCVAEQGSTDGDLKDTLNTLRRVHFPLSFSEFVKGSVEAGTYLIAFQQLLVALVQSGNIDILQTIISETKTDENHPCKEEINRSLLTFMKKLLLPHQISALDKVFDIINENRSVGQLVVLNVFMIPMLKAALPAAVIAFFAKNISWIQSKLNEHLEKRDITKAKEQLQLMIVAFSLVETMFGTLDIKECQSVNSAIVKASGVLEDKKLSKDLLRTAYNTRTMESQFADSTYKELFRLYQCAAYKAVISIISNGDGSQPAFYRVFIFEEKVSHKLWSRIVPTDTEFSFPIDFDVLPKRKKQLVEIRTKILEQRPAGGQNMSILESQSLFSSTLNEDITKYDFTRYSVRTYEDAAIAMRAEESRANIVVELDVDALNQHECMFTLCGLIEHIMRSEQVTPADSNQDLKMPQWMECLKKSLEIVQHKNVKVFILKLILNCEKYFRPYATFWLSPIIQCILDSCLGDSINYMTADVIEMLTKWHEIAKPGKTEYEKIQVNSLLEFLIERCATERKDIFKYNLNLISLVLEAWKPPVPYNLLLQITTLHSGPKQNVQIGLTIAVIILSHNNLPFQENDKNLYFNALKASLADSNRTIYLLSADVIGRILKKLDTDNSQDQAFYTDVCDSLKKTAYNYTLQDHLNRFVLLLHAIQKHYAPIAVRFMAHSKDVIPTLPSNSRVMILEVLLTALSHESWESNPYQDLMQSVFSTFLKMNDVDTQVMTLKIISKMLPLLNDVEVETLLTDVISLSEHSKSRCRDVMYDIVGSYYNRRLAGGDRSSHLVNTCKGILIRGLVDKDAELQKKIYTFWNEEGRLSKTTGDRFVDVLSTLYSPTEEQHFLSLAVCLLLEPAAVNPYCTDTKVFSNPLTYCTYKEYNVTANWRAQHASLAPMFAQTMSSFVATLSTQSEHSFNLRATPASFAFTPTLKSEEEEMDTSASSFAMPSTSSAFVASGNTQSNSGSDAGMFVEPKRRRFVRSKDQISRTFADRNIQKNVKREKMLSERHKKRDAQVNIIRNYRTGDFPDVEIKYTDLLKPLQHLVKRDLVMARQLFVSLYKGLKAQSVNLPQFPSAVHNILETTTQYEPSTIAAMLDVILTQPDEFPLNFDVVTKVCKNSKLLSMGTVLMEHLLLASDSSEPPPAKRSRPGLAQERNNNLWIQLAEMYRCMNEADVVKGIFEDKMASSCGELVQKALQDEAIGYWKGAQNKYKIAIEKATDTAMQDFLYEACFKCCEYMSDWKTLNAAVKHQVEGDLNEIWCDSWTLDHYLPGLITSEISEALTEDSNPTDFLQTVHTWMSDPIKEDHLKSRHGESLCMIYLLRGDSDRCKLYSDNNLSQFIDNWAQLDVLQRKVRAQKLAQLQSMMEIHHYMSLPSSEHIKWNSNVKELLSHWKNNSPSNLDSLSNWETRALYRHFFAKKLDSKVNEETRVILKDAQFCSQISFLDCAIQQRNYYVARKYTSFIYAQIICKDEDKGRDFQLHHSKVKFLQAQLGQSNASFFKMTVEAASALLLGNINTDTMNTMSKTLQIKFHNQIAVLCGFMESVIQKDPNLLLQLEDNPADNFKMFSGIHDISRTEEVITSLHTKALRSLQAAVDIAEEITTDGSSPDLLAETYFELAKYSSQGEDKNEAVMIEALLKAMKYGSSQARQMFPNLLQLPSLSTTNAQLFVDQSDKVAEWMFLQWLPQLLSSLDSKGNVLGPLLERIAKAYPAALQFPFKLSCEMHQNSVNKPPQQIIARLSSLLIQSPTVTALVDALTCLHCRPVTILHYHLKRLKQDIENNVDISTTYETLKKESFLSAQDVNKLKGPLFKSNTKYEERIEEAVAALGNNKENAMVELNKIVEEVAKEEVSKASKPESLLKSYSTFLDSFNQDRHGDIEIPGQYTGHARPIPEQHVMIAGFRKAVQVMKSLRSPVRITIVGNDANERHYLVKFGEDLRQDQRIQQLFGVMNQILATDPDTVSRGLGVDTYNVIPLNSRAGLIAWVYDTDPLGSFITKSELDKHKQAKQEFQKWIFGPNKGTNVQLYSAAFRTYTRKETIENFTRIKNILPNDLLRKAIHKMASSSEAFMYLRSQMLTSHAVLCVCHWLLGIGDRHLSNILVSMKTGRLLGIDFGHAFDTAVGLPIPELLPCRMTPQIVNLAAPLYLKGTVQETMVHTLQSLRTNHEILLSTMNVFIQEPSMNWLTQGNQGTVEGNWYPQEKINSAKKKLQGYHPSWITQAELNASQSNHPCLQYLIQLVQGDKEDNIRATMPEQGLTVRQQVQCLLDQATDQHILGKAYYGWEPYV